MIGPTHLSKASHPLSMAQNNTQLLLLLFSELGLGTKGGVTVQRTLPFYRDLHPKICT